MTNREKISQMHLEQLPVADHKLHGGKHFAGLYAGEHVAATEFVIGATFVALGVSTINILLGLLIGNILAVLSWTLLTAPIAVQTRLSLYTYLGKICGKSMTTIYNWANTLIFTVISAAMITVSALAIAQMLHLPFQDSWYSTNLYFWLVVICVGIIVVFVALYGFNSVANFSSICAPWLFTFFMAGAFVIFPVLANHVFGTTTIHSWSDFIQLGNTSIWTGLKENGQPGIGLGGVIFYAWAANSITHFGLIDMAILRYAKKASYGLYTSFGMLFGHYLAWIAAGIMGSGAAILLSTTISHLDPGSVAYYALGASGFVIILIAGWTTANANLYRATLAAQAVFHKHSRKKVALIVGIITVFIACFPGVYKNILPLLAYSGLLVVPVGAIVATEHFLFPKIGLTRYWANYKNLTVSKSAVITWAAGLVFGFGLNFLGIASYYLFIPTWLFCIVIYTILAYFAGAKDDYSKEIAEEIQFNKEVKEYQRELAAKEVEPINDNSTMTKALVIISYVSLVIAFGLSIFTLLGSPDMETYKFNKELFNVWGLVMTFVYFITAYWALRRQQKLQKDSQEKLDEELNQSMGIE